MLKKLKRNTVQSFGAWKMSPAPYYIDVYDENPPAEDAPYIEEDDSQATIATPIYQKLKSSTETSTTGSHQRSQNGQNGRPPLPDRSTSEARTQTNGQPRSLQNRPLPPEPMEETSFNVPRKPTISELQKALEEANEQLNRFVEERASLHSNDQFRVGDDKIGRESDLLRADIRQWSRKFTRSTKRSRFPLNSEQENPFNKVTNQYQYYLQQKDGKGTPLLVQAYVWLHLREEVFHDFAWSGGICAKKGGSAECEVSGSFKTLNNLLLGMPFLGF